ncbi:hypothetical protein WH96_20600 [Kiloniella spongiae]|uniref:Prepilin-type N-terminal cleavage/methylation domain-containing protein n=1 Tax=Kiloniella spongiae TaxID=1489064 RepID=A0A0H2MQB1_9PROT|nr:type II secretion system protein [Kiloniella spongiae]KLN58885.1 hypothetical protein WH96_20600 [Kiloniella spongiae]
MKSNQGQQASLFRLFQRGRTARHNGEHGFTLLETLIALTILAFSLAVIFQTLSSGIAGITRAERHGYAVLYAKSVMDRVGTTIALTEGRDVEHFDDGYQAEIIISAEEDPNRFSSQDVLNLYMVRVLVRWSAPHKGQYQLQSLKAVARK